MGLRDSLLGKHWKRKQQDCCGQTEEIFHALASGIVESDASNIMRVIRRGIIFFCKDMAGPS
jgi:hypothetical protein